MVKTPTNISIVPEHIDCACVIHGQGYSWTYVERLYNMLTRHLTPTVRLHVYTEAHRSVPAPMIKHELEDFGIGGPRRSWWYKMQMFNPAHHAGPILYFDLDTVIVDNIDWIWNLPLNSFWTLKDFKNLWRPTHHGINSSVMWWDTIKFEKIWTKFKTQPLNETIRRYPGDQDWLTANITDTELRFFEVNRIKSWKWQCLDGGYDFHSRSYLKPGSGTCWNDNTSILIFHGKPKPDQVADPIIQQHWH